jgi:hypothetical protein
MNPNCSFCNRKLVSGIQHSYRADGVIIMVGRNKSWNCDWCNKFWWKGKSIISRGTALNKDKRNIIKGIQKQIAQLMMGR